MNVSIMVELDLTNSVLGIIGHIWIGWPLRCPKNGQEWPKMAEKVKNYPFHHKHMVTQKFVVENDFLDSHGYISPFQIRFGRKRCMQRHIN